MAVAFSSDRQRIGELEEALANAETQVDLQKESLEDLATEAELAGRMQMRLWCAVIVLTLLLAGSLILLWVPLLRHVGEVI